MNGPTLTMGPALVEHAPARNTSASTATATSPPSSSPSSPFPEFVVLAPQPKLQSSSAALTKSATPTLPHSIPALSANDTPTFEIPLFDVSFNAHPDFHTNLFLNRDNDTISNSNKSDNIGGKSNNKSDKNDARESRKKSKKKETGRPATGGAEDAGPAAFLRKGSLTERRLSSDLVPRTKSLTAAAIRKLSHDSANPDGGLGSKLRPQRNSPAERPMFWVNKTSIEIRESERAQAAAPEVRVEEVAPGTADDGSGRPGVMAGGLSSLRRNWKFSPRSASPPPHGNKDCKQHAAAGGRAGVQMAGKGVGSTTGDNNNSGRVDRGRSRGVSPEASSITPRGASPKAPPGTTQKHAPAGHQSDSGRRPDQPRGAARALGRAGLYLTKIKQMSIVRSSADSDTSCASSAASLAPPASNLGHNKQPSPAATSIADSVTTTATTATDEISHEMRTPERDGLWAVFQDLDNEGTNLAARLVPQRMIAINTILLSFLRTYETHASNKGLHPDDLERRAVIFNKWWNQLLDMLDPGVRQQPLSGVDRALVLEAITMVMMRPEWRQASRDWMPLLDRGRDSDEGGDDQVRPGILPSHNSQGPSPAATTVANTATPTAHGNVRDIFIRNLVRQMQFVTSKMSLRYAPSGMAYFFGKACAYAFFFVPGAAEVMVRLWGIRADVLRSAALELGLPARPGAKRDPPPEAELVCASFPSALSTLTWSESRGGAKLKAGAQIPIQVSQIQWDGPWVSRWKGRDTDLLFIFFKYFHLLFAEFVPPGLPLSVQAHAPAFALVHAQLLEAIDATIHRQASLAMEQRNALIAPDMGNGPVGSPPSFLAGLNGPSPPGGLPLSDAQHDSDASINVLHFPSNNLRRGMSQNRLIVMFRDVLSSRMDKSPAARHTFAQASMSMLKAATKRTPRFNQQACFTLCDFLEEVLVAFNNGFDTGGEWAGTETGTEVTTDVGTEAGTDARAGGDVSDAAAPSSEATLQAGKPGLQYIDWRFWLDTLSKMLEGVNTMTEIRVLSFIFAVWDILVADPARKAHVCLEWLLEERMFDKFFNHWCPMVRAYWMRLLCWRVCRDVGVHSEVDTKIFVTVAVRLTTTWSHYLYLKQFAETNARLPPNTAPAEPQPGKRFAIIRSQVNTPQGIAPDFDSFSAEVAPSSFVPASSSPLISPSNSHLDTGAPAQLPALDNTTFAGMSVPLEISPPQEPKKKTSFFSRVLSLASGAGAGNASSVASTALVAGKKSTGAGGELESARAGPRSGFIGGRLGGNKPSPPSSSDGESLASSPETTFVFRFILTWYPPQEGLPVARVLVRPRLPSPAHSRLVVARSRAPSPARNPLPSSLPTSLPSPLPSPTAPSFPSFPLPTRTFSGSSSGGLVDEARNASPLPPPDSDSPSSSLPQSFILPLIETDINLGTSFSADPLDISNQPEKELPSPPAPIPTAHRPRQDRDPNHAPNPLIPVPAPAKPEGFYRERAVYIGRALAEWTVVVHECNTFVERRRYEGVPGLAQVEVPTLGVNEFRRPC